MAIRQLLKHICNQKLKTAKFLLFGFLSLFLYGYSLKAQSDINSKVYLEIGAAKKNNVTENLLQLYNKVQHNKSVDDSLKCQLLKFGAVPFMQTDFSKAQKLLKDALIIAQRSNNFKEIAEIYKKLAILNRNFSAYDQTEKYFFLAIKYYQKINFRNDIIKCNNALAYIFIKTGDFKLAQNYFKKTLILASPNSTQYAETIGGLGILYNNTGLVDSAIVCLNQAKQIFGKHKMTNEYHSVIANLGNSYFRKRDYFEANKLYKESYIQVDKNAHIDLVLQGDNLASALLYLKKDKESLSIWKENIQIINTYNINDGGVNYQSLAHYFEKNKQIDRAVFFIKKAISINLKLGGYTNQSNIFDLEVLKRSVDKQMLLRYFKDLENYTFIKNKKKNILFSKAADSLIDLMRQEHTEQGSKLFWREKTHSLYENALETCYQLKDPKNAFYFMEKSRAILLLDALKDLDAKQVLSATQQSTEQDLRYRVIGLQNKLESLTEKDKNYNATYQQLIDTKEKYNAFIQSLEKTNPAYYQLKYNSKYLTLNDLQNKLKSTNQSFVEYFVGDSAVYVMAITATKVDFKKLNLATYRNLVEAFQTAVSQVPQNSKQQFEAFKYISNQLYAYIFAPLHLPKGRIIISQDNYFIPFAALITDLKNTKYLIEDYAFSYAYSANVLFKKQDENWHFRHQLLGVSPVDFSALGMNSLPKSDETLKAIEQNYFSGKILVKEQATKQNFIENAPKYSLLQLFTHGKADSTEAGSKIYFYDKILKLSELYQLPKLSADLVVLSACQTNLGKNATGEGIMSFARGFAYLNVPSTVSTLWSVDNEATYQVTEAFYKFLDEGFEKDIALQKAQLAYLKNKQIDPYFWSGMVLVGDAEIISKPIYLYLVLGAMGLFVFGGWIWFFRKKKKPSHQFSNS